MTSTTEHTSAPTTPAPAERDIPVRRVSFEESLQDLPKHFANGEIVISHFLAALSSVFPEGEEYFVRSVRHYRSEITDPQLKKDVNGFIGQEVVHGREHRVFNDRLDELGYPVHKSEALTKKGLALIEKVQTPEQNLAVTAALEHFTATMGELLLRDDTLAELIGHEPVRQMFQWHALEEIEHKSVAFDVYRHVGGSEKVRVKTMNRITWEFFISIGTRTLAGIVTDRRAWNPIRLAKSFKRAWNSPLFTKEVWRKLRDYNREGFHPTDHETDDLLEQKRDELFGEQGRITDKLASAA